MGFMDKVKGWLNVGGPRITIDEVHEPIVDKAGIITGKFSIYSERPARMLKCRQRFICVETKDEDTDEPKDETVVLAEISIDTAFDVLPKVRWVGDIRIEYDLTNTIDRMSAQGGVVGALGMLGRVASRMVGDDVRREYFVDVMCDIEGTPFDPVVKHQIHPAWR